MFLCIRLYFHNETVINKVNTVNKTFVDLIVKVLVYFIYFCSLVELNLRIEEIETALKNS